MNDSDIDVICARIAELCEATSVPDPLIHVDGDPGVGEPARRFRLVSATSSVELYLPKTYISAYARGSADTRRRVEEALQGAVRLLAVATRRHGL